MLDKNATTTSTSLTTNTYVLTASIAADGSLQLSGTGLVGGIIKTPRGEDAVVIINDITGYYLFGAEVQNSGAAPIPWTRNTSSTERTFPAVTSDFVNITWAAETADTSKIKYGPVITIKPKG